LYDAVMCKAGTRGNGFPPDTRSDYVGFRVALRSPEIAVYSQLSQDKSHAAGQN